MAFITVNIEGVSDTIAALERIKSKVIEATETATRLAGAELQRTAVGNFHGAHAPGEWHVGGDSPNTVTGNLQRSIRQWPVVRQGEARFMVQVNPTAIYSRVIELGGHITPKEHEFLSWIGRRADGSWGRISKHSVTVPPYPYLRPALESMPPKMELIYSEAWRTAWDV